MKTFKKKLDRLVICLMGSGMILSSESIFAGENQDREAALHLNMAIVHEEAGRPDLAHHFYATLEQKGFFDEPGHLAKTEAPLFPSQNILGNRQNPERADRNPFINDKHPGEPSLFFFSLGNYPDFDFPGSLPISDPYPDFQSNVSEIASYAPTYHDERDIGRGGRGSAFRNNNNYREEPYPTLNRKNQNQGNHREQV